MGSNDYINNYFVPQYYPSSHLYTPEQYAALLIKQYSRQIVVSIIPYNDFVFFIEKNILFILFYFFIIVIDFVHVRS